MEYIITEFKACLYLYPKLMKQEGGYKYTAVPGGSRWSVGRLIYWWNVVTQTSPTVFKSSKGNLLPMIPLTCKCTRVPELCPLLKSYISFVLISCDIAGAWVISCDIAVILYLIHFLTNWLQKVNIEFIISILSIMT